MEVVYGADDLDGGGLHGKEELHVDGGGSVPPS